MGVPKAEKEMWISQKYGQIFHQKFELSTNVQTLE